MPLLSFFSRKDKGKSSSSKASTSTKDDLGDADYVLPPATASMPSLANGSSVYSSSNASLVSDISVKKGRLSFGRKQSAASSSPLQHSFDPPPTSQDSLATEPVRSGRRSTSGLPSRPSVFPSFHDPGTPSTSTRTLPADAYHRPGPALVQKSESSQTSKSSGGLFGWSNRERRKSKAPKPDSVIPTLPPLPVESFNLKSFRHVQAEPSPDTPNRSTTQSPPGSFVYPTPPARPRGESMASTDSAQRISVAAFREAQARRSSTNLASGTPSPTIRPVSVADSVKSDIAPPRPPRAIRPPPGSSPVHEANPPSAFTTVASSSSDASSTEEESESDEGSPSRSRSRLSRQRTITKRTYRAQSDMGHGSSSTSGYSHHKQTTSTRSELGHESSPSGTAHVSPSRGPPPSSFQKASNAVVGTRSQSIYRRQRGSFSTSELAPNAAAQRRSTLDAANERDSTVRQRRANTLNNDTSASDSENESSDDAPLSSLVLPKRPGSSISHSSHGTSSPVRTKPLIDLSMKHNPITGKPAADALRAEQAKARPSLISPTNIESRLSQLTATAGLNTHRKTTASKSEDNLSMPGRLTSPKPSFRPEAFNPPSPVSSRTLSPPPLQKSSGSPTINGRKTPVLSNSTSPTIAAQQFDDEHSQTQPEGFQAIPVRRGRPEHNSGFKVVSRPQKSPTTSPSAPSSPADMSPREAQPPTPVLTHRPHRASFSVISRPSTMATLETMPLVAPMPQQSAKSSSSTGAGSGSAAPPRDRVTSSSQPPPQRPFAFEKRQDSPASSTGGSSNGKAPLTPMDGSDYFSPDVRSSGDSQSGSTSGVPSAMKGGRARIKRASVSFQEPIDLSSKDDIARARPTDAVAPKREDVLSVDEREFKRRERRRSEAKAAIELGNVINGRGPVDDDDDDDDEPMGGNMGPRMSMLNPMKGPGGIAGGMNFNNPPMGWQQQGMPSPMMNMGNMGGSPQPFMFPQAPLGSDPAFLVAHQQAMLIAKQAYQYAVAQQAMAAAGDEWERGSNVGGYTPSGGMGMGYGMGGMNGMNAMNNMNRMNNMGGMGMGSGMWGGASPMFSAGPRSMYAGSTVGAAASEAGWTPASVYGEAFGPSMPANQRRTHGRTSSGGKAGDLVASTYQRSESYGNIQAPAPAPLSTRNGPRPRTRTAPSNTPLPTQHAYHPNRNPPSSWRIES